VKYQCVKNPNVIVVMLSPEAEFRLGEVKHKAVVYSKGGKVFVRRTEEFHAKFKPLKEDKP
jgi:hypothetical protein